MTTNECAHALCARFCLPKFTEAGSLIAKIVGEVSLAFMHGNGRQNSRLLKDLRLLVWKLNKFYGKNRKNLNFLENTDFSQPYQFYSLRQTQTWRSENQSE